MPKPAILIPVLAALALTFSACGTRQPAYAGPGTELAAAPARPEAPSNPGINAYLAGLRYDPRQLLAEQSKSSRLTSKHLVDEVRDDGSALITCKQVQHSLSGNLDDVLILNPTQGVIWPGALVRVDEELVRGTPTPILCRRAPAWLSIDLPGIGGRGVFAVENPSPGTVQAAVDQALDYWNDHQYQEGYVSKARSKYVSTFVYTAEQLAASLGVSYESLKGGLATQFQTTSSQERTVAMALFKQVFYTVSFDPPSQPGAVFDPGVTLDDVRGLAGADAPPAYVSSVDYGRILMLRIETSADTSHKEIEGAVRYLSAEVKASAAYQKTLAKSQVTLITIGGNAEVNASAVDASRIEDLHAVIKGRNALYSKGNPGQPIAYTIRFLKDGRLARMGYATDYTEAIYERKAHGWVGFKHRGAYVAKFFVVWNEGGQPRSWSSGRKGVGTLERVPLKANARDIKVTAQVNTGFGWSNIFKLQLEEPPNTYYVVKGTTLSTSWSTADQ